MKLYLYIIMVFCCLGFPSMAKSQTRIVVPHIQPDDHRHDYVMSLLELALNKTKNEYGDYELRHYPAPTEQARTLGLIESEKGIDLAWSMTSIEREQRLLPIRIPLQKGLLGFRVFLIKPGRQDSFSKVHSLYNLKYFKAGQGHDWPDTKILRYNDLSVIPCSQYPLCFAMLLEDRFDYLPRGLNEPWSEVERYTNRELVVEKTLLLRYTAPIYFFVNRKNTELAGRIHKGLRTALDDGSFDNLFYNHPQMVKMFEKACINKRRIIDLVNPLLPPDTPLEDKSLWFDFDKLP